jgi:hypothetical protein
VDLSDALARIAWMSPRASLGEKIMVPGPRPVAAGAREEVASRSRPDAPEMSSAVYSDEIVAALKELAPEHRAVVVLRYLLDYTPGEIAKALDHQFGPGTTSGMAFPSVAEWCCTPQGASAP